MKTILELMMALTQADNIAHGAKLSAESGLPGAKEVYMAWGKEGGESVNTLEAAWKAAQPEKAKGKAGGFADSYYDWLAEDARSEQEAADYINASDSQNVRNHLVHYLNIWALAASVREGKRVSRTISASGAAKKEPSGDTPKSKKKEPEWEYNSANPYEDVRSAKETLKRE
ncbi:MAG: hypothetical protein RSO15_18140, partial [Bacteroides sp.]|uniref:hypothetical protein n=1 Tax=Bacteroides sp. TaxID=29523 RepID=UPI002FCBB625